MEPASTLLPGEALQPRRNAEQDPFGAVAALPTDQLRAEWRRLYRTLPPNLSRDLLIRGIVYRLQEIEHGGLPKAALRKLAQLAQTLECDDRPTPKKAARLKPGARLVREWHGRTHTVFVTEEGFDYDGGRYTSLTQIARRITGAHWSGPRFFGLGRDRTGHG